MRIDFQAPIPMDDGVVLRADVYRPVEDGAYPVILSYGPYGKGLAFQDAYAPQWDKMVADYPDVQEGSSLTYMNWEVVDPEQWVPHGYVCVRVDSRGAGWSPGFIDTQSPRETRDLYDCIEWAGTRPWSNGKVGMCGISYYATNAWRIAAFHPPHLAAIVPWEGNSDQYREATYHGGILSSFRVKWFPLQVETVQHGLGERSRKGAVTGEHVAGPVTHSKEELAANRIDMVRELRAHPLADEWHQVRSANLPAIEVPLLSAANWGGQGLHPRGNFEGFLQASSRQKWLEVHGDTHWSLFYARYGRDLQRRVFDHFLKGEDNGWEQQPRVQLNVRHPGERFELRAEDDWPIPRTQWTKLYLNAADQSLSRDAPAAAGQVEYEALGDGLTFWLPTIEQETEITGPIAAKLFISSTTSDADLFLVVNVFDPSGNEVTFQGALDPNTPIAQGWLRASRRKLDPVKSLPYRPYHTHNEVQPLTPGEVYEVEVEIWPTCIVVPPGYCVALSVRGKDYEYTGPLSDFAKSFHYASRGCGPFLHDDAQDRPADVFGGKVTIYTGDHHQSYLLLPIVPPKL
ncbi:MAG: CocE/NonD family hydrolase [Chloroflexi bacterium]|nr:CocE/NonD family hydrolase [Chloroflexota bacterium]